MNPVLLGEHEHSLDDKNRLTLPAKFRSELGERVVVSRGLDGCLYVYAERDWEKFRERIASLDLLSAGGRTMQRRFFASASIAELDRQGRLVIPAVLLERTGIGREVTIAGIDDHLEIWDRSAWAVQLAETEETAEDVAERLANRD